MKNNKILAVIAAEYVGEYTLRLTFNNGESRDVDFTPLMQKGICKKLQDMKYFRSFKLDPFTVDWNDEIGFAPEYLYENSIPCFDEDPGMQAAEDQAPYGKK